MEEDIKILEEKIKIIESLCTDDCINKSTVIDPLKYALENLITRYKQLEEENKSKQKAYDDCYCEYKHYKQFDSIPTSLIKEKIEELEKANKNWENMYDEDQEYIVELNNKISNLEWKNEIFVKSIKSHKETIKKLQLENIGYQLSQLPDTSEEYKMLRKQLQELLED